MSEGNASFPELYKYSLLPALPGESQGQRRLVGCRLRGRKESDTTGATYQQQQRHHWL